MGFLASQDVSDSLLRVRLDDAYRPRVDPLWNLPLAQPQRHAIAWAIERGTLDVTHVPVVGLELEGSMPTTKTLAADVANLTALGARPGCSRCHAAWGASSAKGASEIPWFAEEGVLCPEQCTYLPIVSFEIESGSGKQAGGALLNLNAFSVLGVVVSLDEKTSRSVDSTLCPYRPT